MRELVFTLITAAAEAAGLPAGRVLDVSRSDNITIPRPRLEVQMLAATYTRTGRRLAATRQGGMLTRKRELYQLRQTVSVNALAENTLWLESFSFVFARLLPRGVNDARGNHVRLALVEAQTGRESAPRVGLKSIEPMQKRSKLYQLTFTGRVTDEELARLITNININLHWRNYGQAQD